MRLFSFAVLSILSFNCAFAGPITYAVTVDTSSIAGTVGSLDFNFNPGPLATQAASLQLLNFISDGTLTACAANSQGFCTIGDVAGVLPATLTFDNGAALNDYFDGFTYGTLVSFDVELDGPALSASDGVSTSGSEFAFSMFSDAAGTTPVLTTDTTNGFAVTVNVNLDGTTTVNNSSSQTTVTPVAASTPEPSTLPLLIVAGLCLAFRAAWSRKVEALHAPL